MGLLWVILLVMLKENVMIVVIIEFNMLVGMIDIGFCVVKGIVFLEILIKFIVFVVLFVLSLEDLNSLSLWFIVVVSVILSGVMGIV